MGRNDDIQIEIRHAGDSVSNDWFNRRAGEMKSSHSTMQTNSPELRLGVFQYIDDASVGTGG